MAISAYSSITVTFRSVFGNKRIVAGYINFANDTWPSGGVSLVGSDLGIGTIEYFMAQPTEIQWYYDYANGKLDGYLCGTAGAAQVQVKANGATLTTANVYFLAIGRGKG